MQPKQVVGGSLHRRRFGGSWLVRCSLSLALVLMLACTHVVGSSQSPLWNEAEGDNLQLGAMFAPPAQVPQQPSNLEQWQHQQSGLAQQQQQQPATTQAILTELAVALLRAATASQPQQQAAPMQQQQQQQQGMFGGFGAPQQQLQQPYHNLYGPQPPPPQQTPGDLALLAQNAQQRDTILPLFQKGSSAYGFSVPPADVQAKLRRAAPKPISDVARFARISRTSDPLSRWMRAHPSRPFNLDSTVAKHPDRPIPPPPHQRKFKLKTRHMRRSELEPTQDTQAMQAQQNENPFGGSLSSPSKLDSVDIGDSSELVSFDSSPAMLAFSEAEKAMKEADQSMDTTMLETQPAKSKSNPKGKLATASRRLKLPGRLAPHTEFAQPSADFSNMFQSIMNSNARKQQGKRKE